MMVLQERERRHRHPTPKGEVTGSEEGQRGGGQQPPAGGLFPVMAKLPVLEGDPRHTVTELLDLLLTRHLRLPKGKRSEFCKLEWVRTTFDIKESASCPGVPCGYLTHTIRARVQNPSAPLCASFGLPEGTDFSTSAGDAPKQAEKGYSERAPPPTPAKQRTFTWLWESPASPRETAPTRSLATPGESLCDSQVVTAAAGGGAEDPRGGLLRVSGEEMRRLCKSLDANGNGEINYTLFLAAMLPQEVYAEKERVAEVFALFDLQRRGLVDAQDLKRALEARGEDRFERVPLGVVNMRKSYLSQPPCRQKVSVAEVAGRRCIATDALSHSAGGN